MFCIIIMTALKPRQLFCILHKKVVMEDPPTAEAVPPASKGRAYKVAPFKGRCQNSEEF